MVAFYITTIFLFEIFRAHHREEEHILDTFLVGEQHTHAVDPKTDAARWWHAVFQCA